ncbi:MAG: indole-3-glycerol phosphate synthase TrpC [Armatimonadota bacterium]
MILDEILAHKQREIEPLRERFADWEPPAAPPARRPFAVGRGVREACEKSAGFTDPAPHSIALIAEFKRRSPSRGEIRPGALPAEIARTYEQAGASAISVLTDGRYFGGSIDDLLAARAAAALPVLRKDFIIDACQIAESAIEDGPDCVLLIAAALTVSQLRDLRELAAACGQDALVEVHDEAELDRALESGARLIGINNRNLRTFQVSLETALRLRPLVPTGIPVVAESGIRTRDDVKRLEDAGIDAMLVGEALMASEDPAAKVRELLGVP